MRLREANGGANASGDGHVTAKARNSLGRGKKYWNWNWNDSMRSNSDKFLETLEHDLEVDRGCRRSGYCNPVIRITQGRYWFSFVFFFVCVFLTYCFVYADEVQTKMLLFTEKNV